MPIWRKAVGAWVVLAALFAGVARGQADELVCSLADHIRAANTNTAVGACPAGTSHDVITITEDITLAEPLPVNRGTITIEGGGHTISGGGKFRIFDVAGGNLTIRNLTLTEGAAPSEEVGGAIRLRGGGYLALYESTVRESTATRGGGIAITGANDRLTVDRVSFIGNKSQMGESGGAMLIDAGRVEISRSHFSENFGGFFGGAIESRSQVSASNTTFDKNTARVGGAALAVNGGVATMTHVTMVDNRSARGDGSDAIIRHWGTVILRNSIIFNSNRYDDCDGGISESSGNLGHDLTCADRKVGDAKLGEATGSPASHPLLDGSPAIDAADSRYCLPKDQNGTARPQGGGCDVGAVEWAGSRAAPPVMPESCTLPDQIVAANRDQSVGACAAGNGADTIVLLRDFTLDGALPRITTDITIEGNGYTISGKGHRHLIFLVDGGKLSLRNVTLTRGKGAIKAVNGGDVSVQNSRFINNVSLGGGGAILLLSSDSELVVNSSRFIDNRTEPSSTDASGGAILVFGKSGKITNSVFVNNRADFDGGAVDTANRGRVDISNSAFIGNRARRRGGAINTANGGQVNISNSTFIGNYAKYGGALSNAGAVASIAHVTMIDNMGQYGSALWTDADNQSVRLRNSIIAGARRTNTACYGTLTQNIGNLIEDGSCSPMLSGDPMLEEATGSPAYLEPQAGSPAINAADPRFCPETDQIGRLRQIIGRCDIGAIQSIPVTQELSRCAVTTTHGLNLRDAPVGDVIGGVPPHTTLVASARQPGWIRVEYKGKSGWISADYVVAQDDCG